MPTTRLGTMNVYEMNSSAKNMIKMKRKCPILKSNHELLYFRWRGS